MPITTFTHNQKEIFFVDYTDCKTSTDSLLLLNQVADTLKSKKQQVLLLSDVNNAYTGPDFMSRTKELGDVFKSKASKRAVVGIKGLKKILLKAYNTATNDNMTAFSTKEEALKWLTE